MATMQPPDEMQQAGQEAGDGAQVEAEAAPATSGARGRTWAHGMPAMRVQRARWRLSGRPATSREAGEGAGVVAANDGAHAWGPFPPHIRLIRTVAGVILLALAWVGAIAVYLLAMGTFAPLTRQRLLMVLPLRFVEGLGACLLAVVVATLLVVGAFALSLAVRPNDPERAPPPPSAAGEDE